MTIIVGRVDDPYSVYVGRGSALGNPFKMNQESDRNAVCDAYEIWFNEQVGAGNRLVLQALNELYEIALMGDLALGCFCSPKRCHGETIKRHLEKRLSSVEIDPPDLARFFE